MEMQPIAPPANSPYAFDPDSPDAEILEAYEKVRAFRAWFSGQLASGDRDYEDGLQKLADESLEIEDYLRGNWATTPSGVSAQLVFTLFDRGGDAAVERGLFGQGLRALYEQRSRMLDGQETSIVTAAYELLHIEFEQAFEQWEQSDETFTKADKLRNDVEELFFTARKAGDVPPVIADLYDNFTALISHLSNMSQIDRLARTLAPDFECYKRKVEVMVAEEYGREAGPWLLRDINFLTGTIVLEEAA